MEIALSLYGAVRVVAIVVALFALAWALRRMRLESAGQLEQLQTAQQRTFAELQALTGKVSALATLVAAIPARVEQPAETPRAATRREPSPMRSYETARRLARAGATVDEIVATCGVAGSEARLLQRLHRAVPGDENAA